MRARLLLASCALLSAAMPPPTTAATYRVLCYGDSITAGTDASHPESSYPSQLQRMRPDLDVVNEGLAGDVSENLERFREALAKSSPKLVVLMLGTNDAVCSPASTPTCAGADATPERTTANLFRMAEEARRTHAGVLILTPPPVVCNAACEAQPDRAFEMTMRAAFTDRVAEELRDAHPPRLVRVANLRGKLTVEAWQSVSADGLHPSADGNRLLAEFVSAQIPEPHVRQPDHGAKRRGTREAVEPAAPRGGGPQEPNPFVRRPRARGTW